MIPMISISTSCKAEVRVLGALFLGEKRPGSEADHSPPPSAEVKYAWNYTSTP